MGESAAARVLGNTCRGLDGRCIIAADRVLPMCHAPGRVMAYPDIYRRPDAQERLLGAIPAA